VIKLGMAALVVIGVAGVPTSAQADASSMLFGGSSHCVPSMAMTVDGAVSTIPVSFSGWYVRSGGHNAGNRNYVAGLDDQYRNIFVLDMASLSGTVTSAQLTINQANNCGNTGGEKLTYRMYDVTTPASLVAATHQGATQIFDDLGTGTLLGQKLITEDNTDVVVDLNAAGLEALSAAAGGQFAIGGTYAQPAAKTTLTSAPNTDTKPGEAVTLTATVAGATTSGTPTGTVNFASMGTPIAGCNGVALSAGHDLTATATCSTASLGPGTSDLTATYSGDLEYTSGTPGKVSHRVAATPAISLVADPAARTATGRPVTLTTTVTGVDGWGAPTGTVSITDGETPLGDPCDSVELVAAPDSDIATASCTTTFAEVRQLDLLATYSGNDRYDVGTPGGVSHAVATDKPSITAAMDSASARSGYGWYRSPMTVTFACEAFFALDAAGCPAPVTVTENGRGHVVTGTVTDVEGTSTTTSVKVHLDTESPRLVVTGITRGKTYKKMPALGCDAWDRHSHLVEPCSIETVVTRSDRLDAKKVRFSVSVADKAGNLRHKSGRFFVS
jgi:hypothetical protein